ncbi:MAG: LPS assembly lipoprotein LptE [Phycisphaerae bacterium]
MKPLPVIVLVASMGLLVCGLTGCHADPSEGYSFASQYPEDVRTISVPVWTRGRDVYRRGLEMRLTEAIVKRIELDTPYKVVPASRADTQLTGRIESIRQDELSFNPDTGLPRELQITMSVSFLWKDLRPNTKSVRVQRKSYPVVATYVPAGPLNENFFQGSEDLVNELARRIVEELQRQH